MVISNTGGLIAAGSRTAAQPTLRIGEISVIKRIILTFRQAGIFPIVIVTGASEDEVRYELSGMGVIFVSIDDGGGIHDDPELIISVKRGIRYLQGKTRRVVFTPVNTPMYTAGTVLSLLSHKADFVIPSYNEKTGHPVVIDERVYPDILSYSGENGLRGLIAGNDSTVTVPTEDKGILLSVHNEEEMNLRLKEHNRSLLQPTVRIGISREHDFFDDRCKLLLFLIDETGNMRKACDQMALSYTKGWDMINALEIELGVNFVKRRQGGRSGGSTSLTEEGARFLKAFQAYEEAVYSFAQDNFVRLPYVNEGSS